MDDELKPDDLILRLIAFGAEDASPIIATLPNDVRLDIAKTLLDSMPPTPDTNR